MSLGSRGLRAANPREGFVLAGVLAREIPSPRGSLSLRVEG